MKPALVAAYLLTSAFAAALGLLAFPPPVSTATGAYTIEGGSPKQRTEVRRALAASDFDWTVVPAVVRIRIGPGPSTWARPGEIRLSAELLDTGRASWGTVQHEYAHQVDFLLLDDAARAKFARALGGVGWWPSRRRALPHSAFTCERFASTLAWAYWPSRSNSGRPRTRGSEVAAIPPARFRALVGRLLGRGAGQSAAPA
jgi:hypothetical protein